jgi:hypothetical protein
VRKVIEAEVFGLEFDRDSTSESKSPACGRARVSLHLSLSAVSMILTKPKPTNTAEDIIKLQERFFPRWLHDAVAEATYPRVRLGVTVR